MSSTRRTIGVYLNLNERYMSFWINGKHSKKNKNKQLKTPGLAWRPYIRFEEENFVAILKPFSKLPQNIEKQSKVSATLPDNLTVDSHYVVVSYIADLIRTYLFIHTNQNLTDDQMRTDLKVHAESEIEIILPSQAEKSPNNGSVALLKFPQQLDANLYAQKFAAVQKDFSLLDAWNIAKLVHSRYEPGHSYALGFATLLKD